MMFGNIVFVPAQSDSRRAHEFDVPEVFFFVLLACALVPVPREPPPAFRVRGA